MRVVWFALVFGACPSSILAQSSAAHRSQSPNQLDEYARVLNEPATTISPTSANGAYTYPEFNDGTEVMPRQAALAALMRDRITQRLLGQALRVAACAVEARLNADTSDRHFSSRKSLPSLH